MKSSFTLLPLALLLVLLVGCSESTDPDGTQTDDSTAVVTGFPGSPFKLGRWWIYETVITDTNGVVDSSYPGYPRLDTMRVIAVDTVDGLVRFACATTHPVLGNGIPSLLDTLYFGIRDNRLYEYAQVTTETTLTPVYLWIVVGDTAAVYPQRVGDTVTTYSVSPTKFFGSSVEVHATAREQSSLVVNGKTVPGILFRSHTSDTAIALQNGVWHNNWYESHDDALLYSPDIGILSQKRTRGLIYQAQSHALMGMSPNITRTLIDYEQ